MWGCSCPSIHFRFTSCDCHFNSLILWPPSTPQTPYNLDGSVDLHAFDTHVEHQLANGVEVSLPTTLAHTHIYIWTPRTSAHTTPHVYPGRPSGVHHRWHHRRRAPVQLDRTHHAHRPHQTQIRGPLLCGQWLQGGSESASAGGMRWGESGVGCRAEVTPLFVCVSRWVTPAVTAPAKA